MRGEMKVLGQVGDVEVKTRVQAFMANFGAAFEAWTKERDDEMDMEMGFVDGFEDEVAMGFVEELKDEESD